MKKGLFSVVVLLTCCLLMPGCIKNTPYVTTLDPYMTASIGTFNFTAKTVVPSIRDTQSHVFDTATVLVITGSTQDVIYPTDKIILSVNRYKDLTGTFSIVQNQASAVYIHNGIVDPALGGIVAITKINQNSVIGYFSFQTAGGVNVVNGAYSVGRPWNY